MNPKEQQTHLDSGPQTWTPKPSAKDLDSALTNPTDEYLKLVKPIGNLSQLANQFYADLETGLDDEHTKFLTVYHLEWGDNQRSEQEWVALFGNTDQQTKFLESEQEHLAADGDEHMLSLSYIETIASSIRRNTVTVLQWGTWAGKTVGMALAAQLAWYQAHINVPKKKIAQWVARYIHEDHQEQRFGSTPKQAPYGENVGHIVRGEHKANESTDVVYMTDGIGIQAVANMINEGQLEWKLIVLDEFHERNQNMDILLMMLMEAIEQWHNFKLVIMSATINTNALIQYTNKSFSELPDEDQLDKRIGLIRLPAKRNHEVHILNGPERDELTTMTTLLKENLKLTKQNKDQPGEFLIFREGKKAIERTEDDIERELKRTGLLDKVEIVPMHGGMSKEQLDKSNTKNTKPRIYISTNMVGSGVTFDNLLWVSTNGRVKRMIVKNDVEQLTEVQLTQDEILQYFGRWGRTREGFAYIPNISPGYEFSLGQYDKFAKPEMQRLKPSSTLFTLYTMGLGDKAHKLIDPPTPEDIEAGIKELQLLWLLKTNKEVSKLWRLVKRLGIDYRNAISLIHGNEIGVLFDTIILLACQQVGLRPKRHKNGNEMQFPDEFISDKWEALTRYNVFKSIMIRTDQLNKSRGKTNRALHFARKDLKKAKNKRPVDTGEIHRLQKKVNKLLKDKQADKHLIRTILDDYNISYHQYGRVRSVIGSMIKSFKDANISLASQIEQTADHQTVERKLTEVLLKGNIDRVRKNTHWYRSISWKSWEIAPWEPLKKDWPERIIWNLNTYKGRKGYMHQGIINATQIYPQDIERNASRHITSEYKTPTRDSESQSVTRELEKKFFGLVTSSTNETAPSSPEGVKIFCRQLLNQHRLDLEASPLYQWYVDLVKHNDNIVEQAREFAIRSNGLTKKISEQDLIDHYAKHLTPHNIQSLQAFVERINTNSFQQLYLDDISKLIPEYDQTIKTYPDHVTLNHTPVQVIYEKARPSLYIARLHIDYDDRHKFTQESAKQLFPNKTVKWHVDKFPPSTSTISQNVDNIDDFNESILHKALQEKVRKFNEQYIPTLIPLAEHDGDFDIETRIIDLSSNTAIYIWYQYNERDEEFETKIYTTLEQAQEKTNKAKYYYDKYQADLREQQEVAEHLPDLQQRYQNLQQRTQDDTSWQRSNYEFAINWSLQELEQYLSTENLSLDTVESVRTLIDTIDTNLIFAKCSLIYQKIKDVFEQTPNAQQTGVYLDNQQERTKLEEFFDYNNTKRYDDDHHLYDTTYEDAQTMYTNLTRIEQSLPLIAQQIQQLEQSKTERYKQLQTQFELLTQKVDEHSVLILQDHDLIYQRKNLFTSAWRRSAHNTYTRIRRTRSARHAQTTW